MSFAGAPFLYLLPLAALPIVFHFMLRQRKRPMVFSTLMFLQRTDPKLNSRRKLQELLLLLLRTLLILLMLLALSRPMIRSSGQSQRKIAALIVLDNSASMQGEAALGRTKLYQAIEAARRLIQTAPDQARVGLRLTVPDPQVKLLSSLSQDHQALLDILDTLQPTEASASIKPILNEAVQCLAEWTDHGQLIHLFTDLQQAEWSTLAQDLPRRPVGQDTEIQLVCHRIASSATPGANVSVSQVELPAQRILPMHPYTARVHLVNPSSVSAQASLITLDSQGQRSSQQIALAPGLEKTLEIPFLPAEPGMGWIKATIQSDALDTDNTAMAGYRCQEAATVLLVGQRTDYGFLSFALAPSVQGEHTGIVTSLCAPADLDRALQTHLPLLVAMTVNQLTKRPSEALRAYVESGANLLIIPEREAGRETRTLPPWIEAELGSLERGPLGHDLVVLEKNAPFWTALLSDRPEGTVAALKASAFYPIRCTGVHHALLGVDYGKVVLTGQDRGQGHVYICGMGLDGSWSNLPFSGLFVVMMHRMALYGSSTASQDVQHIRAGEALDEPSFDPTQGQIVPLVGEPLHGENAHALSFARSGVYMLEQGERQYGVAVSCAAAEGLESYLSGADIGAVQGGHLQIFDLERKVDFGRYHQGGTRGLALFIPLLFLATLVAVLEGLIAYPNGMAGKQATTPAGAVTITHAAGAVQEGA
jgi:hypothetical protein